MNLNHSNLSEVKLSENWVKLGFSEISLKIKVHKYTNGNAKHKSLFYIIAIFGGGGFHGEFNILAIVQKTPEPREILK